MSACVYQRQSINEINQSIYLLFLQYLALALAQWFVVPGQGFREWLLTLHPFREFCPSAFLDEVPENFALRFRILVVIFIYIYIYSGDKVPVQGITTTQGEMKR